MTIVFDSGFKYHGFHLKDNLYLKADWWWLIAKIEKQIEHQVQQMAFAQWRTSPGQIRP